MDEEGLTNKSVIEKRASLVSQKGAVKVSENGYWNNIQSIECSRHDSQFSSIQRKGVTELVSSRGDSSLILAPDSVQLKRKSGKVSRNGVGCPKRLRMALSEDSLSQGGLDDVNEKTQMVKQRNNIIGKRGDKRNFKAPTKTKFDPFSLKAGLGSFNASAGGNNVLGLYGLKSDIHDITKHMDDISLKELLDGSYKHRSIGKDKGKLASNGNENILHSINRACSILQPQRPLQSQLSAETDSSSSRILSPGLLGSVSCAASSTVGDEGDLNAADQLSSNKIQDSGSGSKREALTYTLDFPMYQPSEVFDRLTLPPPKDLESLLLDAAKPVLSSRNTPDPRSIKSITHRTCLPPFSWSHTFGGHCRPSSDALKLLANKSSCQGGRWVRIENTASFLGVLGDCFTDLSTLVYDHSLVPSGKLKSDFQIDRNISSSALSVPCYEVGSSSQASCSKASVACPENRSNLKYQANVGHSQSLLAAAQTLCDIAKHSTRHFPHGMLRWPKKPLQKAMKARKLKYDQKSEEIFPVPKPVMGSDNMDKCVGQIMPSKKPKLSTENKKDLTHVNGVIKGALAWSAPRSCRSSPNRSVRESASEPKHYSADFIKHQYMLPPPARVSDKACNSQHKQRKHAPIN